MTIYINNDSGVIKIYSDYLDTPRCYYGKWATSGKFYPTKNYEYLIEIGGDNYEVYWENLVIGDIQPITFLDAGRLLGQIFTTGVATSPTPPPPTTIKIDQSENFDIGEYEDFTIEWFMNISSDAYFPRVYSIGAYPSAGNAVSIEGGTLVWWADSGYRIGVQLPDFLNEWHHVAIVRNGEFVSIYFDGILISEPYSYSDPIPGLSDLYLGSENAENTYLDGKMSNFRWTTGTAIYTSNFSVPTSPLDLADGTKLLMLQGDTIELELTDNSGFDNIITNTNTTYNTDNPFNKYVGSILFGNY